MYFILNKCDKIHFLLHINNKIIKKMKDQVREMELPALEEKKIH